MATEIDLSTIRNLDRTKLAEHFRVTLSHVDSASISQQLLSAIDDESLSPRNFHIWLTSRADTQAVVAALKFEESIGVRTAAINEVGRRIRCGQFAEAWNALGGTKGMCLLLATFSVIHVRAMCLALGRSCTCTFDREEIQTALSELVAVLLDLKSMDIKNPETRELRRFYLVIIPACTTDLISDFFKWQDLKSKLMASVLKAQYPLACRMCLQMVRNSKRLDTGVFEKIEPLIYGNNLTANIIQKDGFSQMHKFVLQLMVLLKDETKGIDPPSLYCKMANDLTHRLVGQRMAASHKNQIILSIIAVFEAHKSSCLSLSVQKDAMYVSIVRLWSHHPDIYTSALTRLLQLLPDSAPVSMSRIASLMAMASEHNRRTLLKITLRDMRSTAIDIDSDEDLKSFDVCWPGTIFVLLPRKQASELYQRVSTLRANEVYLNLANATTTERSVLDHYLESDTSVYDIYFGKWIAQDCSDIEKRLARLKGLAAKESEAERRGSRAALVLACAVASGNLAIFADALEWSGIFNTDWATVRKLYSGGYICSVESVNLLSGLSFISDASTTMAEIMSRVQQGNDIMLYLLQRACAGLKEPSFSAESWEDVRKVFAKVTSCRLRNLRRLEMKSDFNFRIDSELVLEATTQMLLKAEETALDKANLSLQLNKIVGPLRHEALKEFKQIKCMDNLTLRFLDNLAEKRDQLFRVVRQKWNARCRNLSEPWPRGLPTWALVPSTQLPHGFGNQMPYLTSRASAIVFMDRLTAHTKRPSHKDDISAIGSYIEDYCICLQLFIRSHVTVEARKNAFAQAWNHVTTQLVPPQFSKKDNIFFWAYIFKLSDLEPPGDYKIAFPKCEFSIPTPISSSKPIKWNPWPDLKLTGVCLDTNTNLECVLVRFHNNAFAHSSQLVLSRRTVIYAPAPAPPTPFSFNPRPATPRQEEAGIAVSLITISNKLALHNPILRAPFPSAERVRLPPLSIESSVIDEHDRNGYTLAFPTLRSYRRSIPSRLLLDLCSTILAEMERMDGTSTNPACTTALFSLLKIAIACDRPASTLSLIKKVLLDRPQDSSWHRHIASKRLFIRLTPTLAEGFLTDIYKQVSERAQNKERDNPAPGLHPAKPVKISTKKKISRLLARVDIISAETAISIPVALMRDSRHIYIFLSAMYRLRKMMKSITRNDHRDLIIKALEQYAIPRVGSHSDNHVLTDEDWQNLRSHGEFPEIDSPGQIDYFSDSLCLLVKEAPTAMQLDLLHRLLLPIINQSADINARLMDLFFQKHSLGSAEILPRIALRSDLVKDVLENLGPPIPEYIFQMWANFSTTKLAPTEDVRKVIERVSQFSTTETSSVSERFLEEWKDDKYLEAWRCARIIYYQLNQPFEERRPGDLTLQQVWDVAMRQVQAIIIASQQLPKKLEAYLELLKPPIPSEDGGWYCPDRSTSLCRPTLDLSEEERWKRWQSNIRPLLEQIIQRLDSFRTPEWQQDPNPNLSILYDTFGLKLRLLNYPYPDDRPDLTEALDQFAQQVIAQIVELVSETLIPYHHHLEEIKKAAMKVNATDYCYLSCKIGDLKVEMGTQSELTLLLRVDLADCLLQEAGQPTREADSNAVKQLLNNWCEDKHEDIRRRGKQNTAELFDRLFGHWPR